MKQKKGNAVDSLKYVEPVLYDQLIELNDEISICFNDAGHIIFVRGGKFVSNCKKGH